MEEGCSIIMDGRELAAAAKAIVVYLTCEGRYNRVMIYHFKLMKHFTGKKPLDMPFYLHKSLGKMAHQLKSQPYKIVGRSCHHGFI